MAAKDQTALIRRVLYTLKRRFGLRAEIIYQSAETTNLMTGEKTVEKQSWTVNKAVLLPTKIHRDFVHGPSFMAANGNFAYGGTLQTGIRQVIIDCRDLPSTVQLGLENWYMVIDHKRYEITEVEQFDESAAWFVTIKHLDGAPRNEILSLSVEDRVTPKETYTETT